MTTPPPESGLRNQAGRFAKGSSGNPSGKSKGTRNRTARALDDLADADIDTVRIPMKSPTDSDAKSPGIPIDVARVGA